MEEAKIDPEHRAMIRDANQHAALAHAERIGTPQGLRNLFPTNHVQSRTRRINLQPIQEKFMASRQYPRPPAPRPDLPGDNPQPQSPAPVPSPAPAPQPQPQAADPGPPPQFPAYAGDTRSGVPVQIDQLLLAGEARDREAANAVSTLNVPPEVGQFKAAVLEWLDSMDTYENAHVNMPRGQPRAAEEDQADIDLDDPRQQRAGD